MITTLLLIAIYVETVSETLLRVNPLYIVITASYALTIAYVWALKVLPRLELQAYLQTVVDLLLITGLVYVTGGTVKGGFMLLYPISVLAAGVLLSRRRALTLAFLAALFYAGILSVVRLRLVPASGLWEIPALPLTQVVYSVFMTGVACVTVALTGAYLSESLRSVGAQLEEVTGQVADLRELNELIVDSMQSGLLTSDGTGRVLFLNPFGESILGKRAAEIRGKPLSEVFATPALALAPLEARAATTLRRFEVFYHHPDGRRLDFGMSVSSLGTDRSGEGGYLVVFQDVTEIKRLEKEVQINEKLAAVGEMAAHLAHEIRNPLGSISGSAQVLMVEPHISPDQERLLAIIRRECKRLSDSLNQFLIQARPGSRSRSPVDLRDVISEAVTLLKNSPEVGALHSVEFGAAEGPHICLGDRDQLLQVFWNLARNGLEAMPDGGLLRVELCVAADDVVLSIRDQGRGIAHEDQSRIFEPFQSRTSAGTGLGLAIVYRIVREHNGDIIVDSVPQQGTEVTVRLPLLAKGAPAVSGSM
jgi:two-component system sensor histidine kinase PilS (NtrC family)